MKDLFEIFAEQPEKLPNSINKLIDNMDNAFIDGKCDYQFLANMVSEFRKYGYNFDYYLNAEPYELRRIKYYKNIKLYYNENKNTISYSNNIDSIELIFKHSSLFEYELEYIHNDESLTYFVRNINDNLFSVIVKYGDYHYFLDIPLNVIFENNTICHNCRFYSESLCGTRESCNFELNNKKLNSIYTENRMNGNKIGCLYFEDI